MISSLDDIAAHVGQPRAGERVTVQRSAPVELAWDTERSALRLRAPLAVDPTTFDARDLAVAIAELNLKLEVLGIEHDTEVAFVSHVFFDANGQVAPSALDRLLLAVDECVAATAILVRA